MRSEKISKDNLKQMKMREKQPNIYGTQQKVVIKGKFIILQAYLKKIKSQINLISPLEQEKKNTKFKLRTKDILKIRAEINKIESKKK